MGLGVGVWVYDLLSRFFFASVCRGCELMLILYFFTFLSFFLFFSPFLSLLLCELFYLAGCVFWRVLFKAYFVFLVFALFCSLLVSRWVVNQSFFLLLYYIYICPYPCYFKERQ